MVLEPGKMGEIAVRKALLSVVCVALATSASAATYVVPTDEAFVKKAHVIVVARALSSFVQDTTSSGLETVTDFAVEDVVKGSVGKDTFRVRVPGGSLNGRFSVIPGAPRFVDGERVLLFVNRQTNSDFTPTDFGLGQFGFAVDDRGRTILMRAESEIAGWDISGAPHREPRREASRFLNYIRAVSRGELVKADYFVSEQPLIIESASISRTLDPISDIAPYTATSYTIAPNPGTESSPGFRWKTFPQTIRQGNQLVGAPGGGSTAIQTAINAWNNETCSSIGYQFGGLISDTDGVRQPADGVNNVVWEKSDVGTYSCSSGGVLGLGGIRSAESDPDNKVGSEVFLSILEVDVSMSQGIQSCPAIRDSPDLNTAVAHELGHTLGFRHSDKNRTDTAACTGSSVLECSSSAVMRAVVPNGINAALQTWDQHAAQAVYPGTCSAGARVKGDINGDGFADLIWRHSNGNNYYWMMNNASIASTGALVSVPSQWKIIDVADLNNDGKSDIFWRNTATGETYYWLLNGAGISSLGSLVTVDLSWTPVALGDINGDGNADVIWRRTNGETYYWLMSGGTILATGPLVTVDPAWKVAGVADLNNDGYDDIFWRNSSTGDTYYWLMNNGSISSTGGSVTVATVWNIAGVADISGDGKADIIWRHSVTGDTYYWLMNGGSISSTGSLVTVPTFWKISSLADINGDGRTDLIWRNTVNGDTYYWLMNGGSISSSGPLVTVADLGWDIAGPK
jgi:hypothetical protein